MFEITGDHIALLRDDDLRTLVGRLCEEEVRKLGFATSTVTWGGDGCSSFRFAFSGYERASRVRKPLRLFFLPNDFQPAARAGPGWGGYGRDHLRHTV